jgi:hypothetical protein
MRLPPSFAHLSCRMKDCFNQDSASCCLPIRSQFVYSTAAKNKTVQKENLNFVLNTEHKYRIRTNNILASSHVKYEEKSDV